MNQRTKILFLSALCAACLTRCNEENVGPRISSTDFTTTVAENPVVGQSLGVLDTSVNQGELTFSVGESIDFDGAFAINASTGELTIADPTYFNFEENSTVTGIVLASAGGVTNEINVTVTITNVNEISMANLSLEVSENPEADDILFNLSATSTDAKTITYELANVIPVNALKIGISEGVSKIRVNDEKKFNFELYPIITATVRAIASVGPDVSEATVTITLTDLPETVQERLDDGETPLQIFNSNNALVNQLFAKSYAGGIIGAFNTTTGSCLILSGEQPQSYTAGAAITAANALVLNGYEDWRLPTETEANSLSFALSTGTNVLPTGTSSGYWTSTGCGGICVKAFYIGSSSLGMGSEPASNLHPLMAVRIQN
jgi:hypothetical protein